MAKFKLPVVWEMGGFVTVEADSVEAAMEYFEKNVDHIPLPKEGVYVDASFALSCDDPEFILSCNE